MAADGEPSQRSLTRDPDFMKFWVGQSVAVFGAQFSPIAIQFIAVITLKVSPLQLGILGFLNTAPFLFLGLLVGVWLDRHSRRRTLLAADFGRSLVLLCIPLSFLLYTVTLSLLYLVTLAAGVLTVFFEIGYQSYVPSLVDKPKLVEANGKLEATRSLSQALGPTVAGGVCSVIAYPLAVLGDTLGYCASWVSLALIRRPEGAPPTARRSAWVEIREGLSLVYGNRFLRAIAGTNATVNFFSAAFFVLLTKFFLDDLGMTTLEVGLVFGVGSLGGVLGAVLAMRVVKRAGVGRSIVIGALVFSLLSTCFYLVVPANGVLVNVAVSSAILFFSFVGVLVYNITQVSYRQALVGPSMQGRMNATMRTLVWGVIPLGNLAGGAVAEVLGVRETVVLMAFLIVLSPLWVLLSPVRKVRDFPEA